MLSLAFQPLMTLNHGEIRLFITVFSLESCGMYRCWSYNVRIGNMEGHRKKHSVAISLRHMISFFLSGLSIFLAHTWDGELCHNTQPALW